MQTLTERLNLRLSATRSINQYRSLEVRSDTQLDYSSNDYLGIAHHHHHPNPGDLKSNQSGAGASRLLSGTSNEMLRVEKFLADFYSAESALIFSSGYQANIGLVSGIAQKGDYILYDEFVHASLRDGIRMSHARAAHFSHNCTLSLREKLERIQATVSGTIIVVIESLYSMDGDIAPLVDIVNLVDEFDAALIVDEAHSTAVFGATGNGLICELQLETRVFARVHTFGKGLGYHGACIVGPGVLKETLVNYSRPFIYTTAPPESFFTSLESFHLLISQSEVSRQRLGVLSQFFNSRAMEYAVPVISGDSAIKAIPVPGNTSCKKVASALQQAGFDVRAVLSPTVSVGGERLRICLHSFNQENEIERLLHILSDSLRAL